MQGFCFHNTALEHQKRFWPLPDRSVACAVFEESYHKVLTERQELKSHSWHLSKEMSLKNAADHFYQMQ